MNSFVSKIRSIRNRRVSLSRSLWYTWKYPARRGKFVAVHKTIVDAAPEDLIREGAFHAGCPKGLFGHIGIPGADPVLIKVDRGGKLRLGDGACLYPGVRILVAGQGDVQIGTNTSIAANSYLLSRSRITIGSNCAISWDCQIIDSDFHQIADENGPRPTDAPVVIGDHVLICSKVTVLKGVHIGDHAIIAANSVVTSDVPDHCIAAGNPARIVKENIDWN